MNLFHDAIEFFTRELDGIRTGRATPALIENVSVPCYGSSQPLKAVASIGAPEPSLLAVEVWDESLVPAIDKALQQANLGMMPSVEGKFIRLRLPALTEERRKEFIKLAKQKQEQAKLRIRQRREETLKDLRRQAKEGGLSEDAVKVQEKALQKDVDEAQAALQRLADDKERELLTI